MTSSGRPHPFLPHEYTPEEKRIKRKIKFLRILLVLLVPLLAFSVSGAVYTLVSNHSHVSFSFNTGTPVFASITPGSTSLTVVNFTVNAFSTLGNTVNNLFVNITIDNHPPSQNSTSFKLNGVPALNQTNPQWIVDGPFSLAPNQSIGFSETFTYSGIIGFYDIDASILQLS